MSSNRVVAVTGATGFVGRSVLAALETTGVQVKPIIRSGARDRLPTQGHQVVTTEDLFQETDDWWTRSLDGVDTIIHCAWYAEPGRYLNSATNLQCLTGTLELAKGAARAGVRRLVGIGTCFEYDLSQPVLTTKTPLRPESLYASTKAATFLALTSWSKTVGISFAWCRLFYLYGNGESPQRLFGYIRSQLERGSDVELTSGQQIRDYLDVAIAGVKVVETALVDVEGPVNICSGQPATVRSLAEALADEYGMRERLRFGVRPENVTDPICVVGVPGTQ